MEKTELQKRFRFEDENIVLPDTVPEEFREWVGKTVPLRSHTLRSVFWLEPVEASLFGVRDPESLLAREGHPDSGKSRIAISNFRHAEQHWVAVLLIETIDAVLAQQQVFLRSPWLKRPLAAHGQLRFILDEGFPIELYPQEDDQSPYGSDPVDDFIVSAEAVPPDIEGFPDYNLIGGARGWFRQSLRFVSTSDKAEKLMEEGRTVNQFLLALKKEEAPKALVESVRRSDEIGLDSNYHTLAIGGTQCVYEMFNILDRAILKNREDPTFSSKFWRMFDRMPLFIGRYLSNRGLRYSQPDKRNYPTLNEEVSLSPEQQDRLRERISI